MSVEIVQGAMSYSIEISCNDYSSVWFPGHEITGVVNGDIPENGWTVASYVYYQQLAVNNPLAILALELLRQ